MKVKDLFNKFSMMSRCVIRVIVMFENHGAHYENEELHTVSSSSLYLFMQHNPGLMDLEIYSIAVKDGDFYIYVEGDDV